MRKTPILDPRDEQAILEEIRRRARSYVPEWRNDPDDMDGGGALAAIFAHMFSQTVDRYNRVLHKDYIEFLNLLSVRQKPVTPATGYVAVEIAPGTEEAVEIPRDTALFHDGEDGERVNYRTDETIFATPARIVGMVTVDPAQDAVAVREAGQEAFDLFFVPEEHNRQRHAFVLRQDEALRLSRPATIRVQVGDSAFYLAQQTAGRLSDPAFAAWEYRAQGQWRAFDAVVADGDCVVLRKDNALEIEPCPEDEGEEVAGGACIRCTMRRAREGTRITVRSLRVQSAYAEGETLPCTEAYANDVRVDAERGGYCFSDNMMPYDAFYIAADEVLCKRGADVVLEMDMHTLVRKSEQEQALYEFRDKMVIEKEPNPPEPPRRYVSAVAWEYWNGVGWTHLAVAGDENPFGEGAEGTKRVTFSLPEDAAATTVGAVERIWVRARATAVENAFNLYATRLLPFVTGLRLSFRYRAPRPVQALVAQNNLARTAFAGGEGEAGATLYAPLPDAQPALYLCFDAPPAGYPVSFYWEMQGRTKGARRIGVEAFLGRDFEEVPFQDGMEDCTHSGVLKCYLPRLLQRTEVFGLSGYFVRIVDRTGRAREDHPRIRRIVPNCAHITQRERAPEEIFSTEIHESGKRLRLDEGPVLEAEVWVDELPALSGQEAEALRREAPERTEAEYAGDGRLDRLFVRWERVESLALCGPQDRAFALDAEEARVDFGDGVHGAIPPAGEDNIRVRYSFGGGRHGNIAEDQITGITTAAAGITRVWNFLPICGGNDMQSVELVERLGPKRLRHRGRAVTKADFEALVLEAFSEVRAVRCFPNTDETGAHRPGHVAVVLLTGNYDSEAHTIAVCEQVEHYLRALCDSRLAREGLHVLPAMVMTVNVTASVEVDAPDNAAQAERGAQECLQALLDPFCAERGENPIGALPGLTDLYAALRRVPHILAVRDVLLEGSYYDYNRSRVVALDVGSSYPFAVPRSGRHVLRI